LFGLGPTELIVILIIALVIFGPRKLPEVGQQLGRALREFKKSAQSMKDEISDTVGVDEITSMKADIQGTADSVGLKDIREELTSVGDDVGKAAELPDVSLDLEKELKAAPESAASTGKGDKPDDSEKPADSSVGS